MSVEQGPYFDLVVERVVEETSDAKSVVLRVPTELQDTFRYQAGQFLTFGIKMEDHNLVRCYSLASSPDTDPEHKVTIKRVDEGRVSNYFNDHVTAGQTLRVMKPLGNFCLQSHEAPIFLFAGGSGITPVISIIKSALATTSRSITLVYANRDRDSIIFKQELDELGSAHAGRLAIHHRLDDVDGFLDVGTARELIAEAAGADFYVCGPGAYMDVIEEDGQNSYNLT